jgi:hypothetical protein
MEGVIMKQAEARLLREQLAAEYPSQTCWEIVEADARRRRES